MAGGGGVSDGGVELSWDETKCMRFYNSATGDGMADTNLKPCSPVFIPANAHLHVKVFDVSASGNNNLALDIQELP